MYKALLDTFLRLSMHLGSGEHLPGFYPQWRGSRPRKTSPTMRQASWSIPTSFLRRWKKVNIVLHRRFFGFHLAKLEKLYFLKEKVCHGGPSTLGGREPSGEAGGYQKKRVAGPGHGRASAVHAHDVRGRLFFF